MTLSALWAACAALDQDAVATLALRLLQQWSPPGHEAPVAEAVADALVLAGADRVTLDEEFPGSPSVLAWLHGTAPGPTLQWHGHLDAIATPHEPARREGDVLVGRGACDMKGAIAAMVAAVGLLRQAGHPRHGQVLLTFHGLHEEGGNRPLLRLIERGVVGDAVLIGELASGDQLVTAGRGLSFWDVTIGATAQAVHETHRTPQTPDALAAAVGLLADLRRHADEVATGGGSLFVGKLAAGDYHNRTPAWGTLAGTRRHSDVETLDEVRRRLEAVVLVSAEAAGVAMRTEVAGLAEAYAIDPEAHVARALRSAYGHLTGRSMMAGPSQAVGNAAQFVHLAGVPAVYHGCDYATAHSDREVASVSELAQLARVYAVMAACFFEPDRTPVSPPLKEAST